MLPAHREGLGTVQASACVPHFASSHKVLLNSSSRGVLLSVMATEIHEVGRGSPPAYEPHRAEDPKKEEDIVGAAVVDLEGSFGNDSKEALRDRAEATELTPAEAFRWNVEGDQSPCKSSWESDNIVYRSFCPHADL